LIKPLSVIQEKGNRNMSWNEEEDKTIYKVVVNHEEQYSIWPAERKNPAGWRDVDKSGLKPECLAYIQEIWTDMRPLSLRKHMESLAGKQSTEQA
jgi:MbtH protein